MAHGRLSATHLLHSFAALLLLPIVKNEEEKCGRDENDGPKMTVPKMEVVYEPG